MTIRVEVLVIALVTLLVGPSTMAGQELTQRLKQAESLRCVFGAGHGFEWQDGEFVPSRKDNEDPPVVFDRIDRDSGHARQVYSNPATGNQVSDVVVVESEWRIPRESSSTYGLTFVEIGEFDDVSFLARGQWVSMTTVWAPADPPAEPSIYPAVFSHHLALTAPIPSQFQGWCRIQD